MKNSNASFPQTDMTLQPGTRLGHYEITSLLGSGGMGEVYRAKDHKLGRDVAIKVLKEELATDPERLRRFEQEARSASALNHPNIITIYDLGQHETTHYIAMELVEGKTLREMLSKGPLPTTKLLQVATQIAEGLAKAHSAGIIHRDLKPENIMVTSDGLVKTLDFGLAKLMPHSSDVESETATVTKATKQGVVMGTVQYMSPEQGASRPLDFRSDQFSFGSILYEMATGKLPFKKDTIPQTLAAIIEADPEPIDEINPKVPVELSAIVERCLSKDPGNRYESTEDLARELKAAPETPSPWSARRKVSRAGIGVAVLPLRNLSGDPEQEYFADGMTEALITDLAKIGALKVISRSSAMRYKGTDKALTEIARELGIDAVVEGSALRVGGSVRIMAQLIDPKTEQALWAESYEQDLENVLLLWSEVAQAIAGEVQVALTPEETRRLAGARPINPEAYEAYLKGMSHLYKLTPLELDAALHYFERALEIDPNYALAYAGISYVWLARQQMGLVIPSEATPKAKDAAQKALEIDDALPEVHYTWACIRTWSDWDWAEAEQAFKRALELKPNYPDALVYYSNLLCYMGRLDEALAMAEQAVQLDPLNSIILTISGTTLSYLHRYDDTIERAQNALKTSPNDPVAYNSLWESYHKKGMYEESLESAKAFFTGLGFAEIAEVMAQGYEEGGYSGAMTSAAETMAALSNQTYISPYSIAMMYALAGNGEKTIEWLEMGYEMKDPMMPYVSIFTFDLLDDDPRYQDLLRRMNLPEGD
jgi:serine/threonine protein kinase/Tfp pilus assembly protein PilF